MAATVNLLLALEGVVAELAVEGGQGQVAERVDEGLMDLVRVLTEG